MLIQCSDPVGQPANDGGRDSGREARIGDQGEYGLDSDAAVDAQGEVSVDATDPTDLSTHIPGTWLVLAAGTFSMGSPESELCRAPYEDRHQVTLTHGFEIQSTEVTQEQFEAVLGYNNSYFANTVHDRPVESVSWHMAADYCNALSARKGLVQCYECTGSEKTVRCATSAAVSGPQIYACPGYRLPTEAEWEYAYRAATQTATYAGSYTTCNGEGDPVVDGIGWHYGNAGGASHPVGQKQPNLWQLYDMAGNVREWCHDWFEVDLGFSSTTDPFGPDTGTHRVIRGGSWATFFYHLRAAYRYSHVPEERHYQNGFRCVRTR